MASRCSAYEARRQINTYVNDIETLIREIQRNFNDMDFENADAREDVDSIITNMKNEYSRLISELNSYSLS